MKKQLCSTRGSHIEGDFWTAVRNGVADDGGLIIPTDWENRQIDVETLPLSYLAIAQAVLACFTDGLDEMCIRDRMHSSFGVDQSGYFRRRIPEENQLVFPPGQSARRIQNP